MYTEPAGLKRHVAGMMCCYVYLKAGCVQAPRGPGRGPESKSLLSKTLLAFQQVHLRLHDQQCQSMTAVIPFLAVLEIPQGDGPSEGWSPSAGCQMRQLDSDDMDASDDEVTLWC